MYSYADSFEQPIVEKIGDKEITIPLLSQRAYLPWIEEETVKAQERARKNAPPPVKVKERADWMESVDAFELTPAALRPHIFRASGTVRVLKLALTKAGMSEEDAEKFIDSRPAKANEILAVRVSGLFRREEIEQLYPVNAESNGHAKQGENPDPNAQSPNAGAPA